MEQVQIDAIVRDIEVAFGPETPFSAKPLTEVELYSLKSVFGDTGYQEYLQDQVHRQIIRDYLTNAVLLNCIDEDGFSRLMQHATTIEGRSSLSLHMLMRSVEEAQEIPIHASQGEWHLLRGTASTRPQLELIPS
ncbi:MAG: hypothetical protein ABJ013_11495 [Halioglobus sp.]